MAPGKRIVIYVLLIAALYFASVRVLRIKVSKEETEFQKIASQVDTVYDGLINSMGGALDLILRAPQEDTVRAVILSRCKKFSAGDSTFKTALHMDDFENAIFIMNQQSSVFFELINYSWERISRVQTDTSLTKELIKINDLELRIDSLLMEAKKSKQKLKTYSSLYRALWPFQK
jgi:hypothetical protein